MNELNDLHYAVAAIRRSLDAPFSSAYYNNSLQYTSEYKKILLSLESIRLELRFARQTEADEKKLQAAHY